MKKLSQTKDFPYDRQFEDELTCLTRVKHKNIVRFLGYCDVTQVEEVEYYRLLVSSERRQRLLCFEYLNNGSLCNHIKGKCAL